MWLLVFFFLAGISVLVFGVRKVLLQRRLQREGIPVSGTVVGYVRRSGSEDAHPSLFAVVGFTDADGKRDEVRATSSGTKWPIGHPVPVVYLPGAPSTARLDLSSERHSRVRVLTMVGGAFTILPIVIMTFGLSLVFNLRPSVGSLSRPGVLVFGGQQSGLGLIMCAVETLMIKPRP